MEHDERKIDRAALAILLLNYEPSTGRSWKSLGWDIMDRLFEAGLISDPKNKNKTVVLTDLGLKMAEEVLKTDFK